MVGLDGGRAFRIGSAQCQSEAFTAASDQFAPVAAEPGLGIVRERVHGPLIFGDEAATGFPRQQHAAFLLAEVGGPEAVQVDGAQHHAVDDRMAERLDQVQRQAGAVRGNDVVETQKRIKAQCIQQRPDLVPQQHIAEAEHGIDRILRRAAGPPAESQRRTIQVREAAKVGGRGSPFETHE